jgi:hypothetical protein
VVLFREWTKAMPAQERSSRQNNPSWKAYHIK